jgi:shikimate kinase
MEIILVGYMGSGKSTIAQKLSKVLDLKSIDLDDYIAEKEGISIPEIFKKKGEIYFRKLETKTLKEIFRSQKNYVLSVGGGTPCYDNNIELIIKYGVSFYLKASLQTLYKRLLKEKNSRPLIKNIDDQDLLEFIAKHLFERNRFYEKTTHTIKIDGKDVAEIVEEIILNTQ